MKKIFFASLALPLLALFGCHQPEEIVFDHEQPQFETRADAILLEVIVPYSTNHDSPIYITGPAIGLDEQSVLGNDQWKLTQSSLRNKYGIYINPNDLPAGASLSDGYYFVSLDQGREVGARGEEDVMHTTTAPVGQRAENVWVRQWYKFFHSSESDIWPAVPAGMIQLRVTIPETTPMGYPIAAVGEFNGWNATDEKYRTTAVDATHHYVNINPAEFAEEKTLADNFKFAVIVPGQEWWHHESNEDGSDNGGQGFEIGNAIAGLGYELTVLAWRNSADLPEGIPVPSANQFLLMITVPDYTPENSLIGVFGNWNGWGAMLDNREPWTATMFTPTLYYLMVDPSLIESDVNAMFHVTLYYDDSTDGNWWRHQANEDGSPDEGAGINNPDNTASPQFDFVNGNTYNITVAEWRNSDDIKGVEPDDISVTPWKGLTVDPAKILLQIEVPGSTPDNSIIRICGSVNGWTAGLAAFEATQYSAGRYYMMLDPADFSAGASLADEFKIYVHVEGKDWWYTQNNSDGTDVDGPGITIPGATAGKAYTISTPNWRNAAEIPGYIVYPPVPADKIVIQLSVPDNTPDDAVIALHGDVNNWDGSDLAKWGATKINKTRYLLELDPANFAAGTGLTKDTTPNGFSFAILVAGKDWWYFQSDDGNMLIPGEEVGATYYVTVTAWKNAGEL